MEKILPIVVGVNPVEIEISALLRRVNAPVDSLYLKTPCPF